MMDKREVIVWIATAIGAVVLLFLVITAPAYRVDDPVAAIKTRYAQDRLTPQPTMAAISVARGVISTLPTVPVATPPAGCWRLYNQLGRLTGWSCPPEEATE